MPLIDRDNTLLGASNAFTDVTSYNRVNRELELSKQALETASKELQATNEELESTTDDVTPPPSSWVVAAPAFSDA